MDYGCECGNEVGGYDEHYVVMCHKCGENMKPLTEKLDPSAKLACSDGLEADAIKERCEGLEEIQRCFEDAATNVIKGLKEEDKKLLTRGLNGLKILIGEGH